MMDRIIYCCSVKTTKKISYQNPARPDEYIDLHECPKCGNLVWGGYLYTKGDRLGADNVKCNTTSGSCTCGKWHKKE